MKFIRDLEELPTSFQAGALTIGNFDGMHRGHAVLIQHIVEAAREVAGPTVVFTFDPHPIRVLRPDLTLAPLLWAERKTELLGQLGVDLVVAYPTDQQFLALTPEAFFAKVVRGRLGARAVVEGADFCFGHNREGTIDTLQGYCDEAGIVLQVVDSVLLDGEIISSSRIRELIQQGELARAARMLSRPYRVRGVVGRGAARGATIGFPTANLESIPNQVPGFGVYAGRAHWSGRDWPAAVHVGPNPTFEEKEVKFEVHLIGFEGNLYGQVLEVDIMERLREMQTFDSTAALQKQLQHDVEHALQVQAG